MARTNDHQISRRSFLGAIGATPLVSSIAPRSRTSDATPTRVAVVGAGAIGGWIALELVRAGAEVVLIDAWHPGNSRSSSGGEGRALRAIYGPDRVYTEMVVRSRELWRGLEKATGTFIYSEVGALWMIAGDDAYIREALPILDDLDLGIDRLTFQQAGSRFPQIDFAGVEEIYFEPGAGVLLARESCRVVAEEFVNLGGTYRTAAAAPLPALDQALDELRISDGTSIRADLYVLACGPWLGSILPDLLGATITPTRQEVYYFGTPPGSKEWQPQSLPVWVELGRKVVYGFPDNLGRGFKFADDTRGPIVDPSTLQRTPTAELVEAARTYLGKRFPDLAQAPLIEARICQYENSPDGHLILDRHPGAPNLWIAGGGSGHGFKLAPAVGELMARAILEDESINPKFSLARLGAIENKRTQFEFQEDAG